MPKNAGDVIVKIGPVVGPLKLRLRLDGTAWVAQVVGQPATASGTSKEEAIRNAVGLYLQVLQMRLLRGLWIPRMLKQDED